MNIAKENIANVIDTNYTASNPEAHDKLDHALDELIRGFGNCLKCWGKGYSTNFYGTTASPDFEGDIVHHTPKEIHVEFCSCERGKSLEKLWPKQT